MERTSTRRSAPNLSAAVREHPEDAHHRSNVHGAVRHAGRGHTDNRGIDIGKGVDRGFLALKPAFPDVLRHQFLKPGSTTGQIPSRRL